MAALFGAYAGPVVAVPGADAVAPLWRAAQVFRALSCLYALGFQVAVNSELQRPRVAWVLCAVLLGFSAVYAIAYLRVFGRRPGWVITEIVVVVALMWSNRIVASTQWASDNQTWPMAGSPPMRSISQCNLAIALLLKALRRCGRVSSSSTMPGSSSVAR